MGLICGESDVCFAHTHPTNMPCLTVSSSVLVLGNSLKISQAEKFLVGAPAPGQGHMRLLPTCSTAPF